MNLWALIARLDRLQKARTFKIVASVVVVALIVSAGAVLAAFYYAPSTAEATRAGFESAAAAQESLRTLRAEARGHHEGASLFRAGAGSVLVFGIVTACAVALLIVWLGLALTYLGIGAAALIVAGPFALFESTRPFALLLLGALTLSAAFTALLRALHGVLSAGSPIAAVAKNTLSEAVRLRISVVFIVMLVFLVSSLPMLLDDNQPLRYRVQLFLTYGAGGAFWVLAFLTVFFSIASVAFEQRDRIIWQTMTKPVSHLQYVLGKWLGVVALNGALLLVSAMGVFLFTEHLRNQPAMGEAIAYVNADGTRAPTSDRRLLERQVLVARSGSRALPPVIDPDAVERAVEDEVQRLLRSDSTLIITRELREFLRSEFIAAQTIQYRTLDRGEGQVFVFDGLRPVARANLPFTLRFRVSSGSDNPSNLYRMLFYIPGLEPLAQDVPLGVPQTIDVPDDFLPRGLTLEQRQQARAEILQGIIDEDGRFAVQIFNGDPRTGHVNMLATTFEPGALEVLYVAGGYESNFLRVMLIMWAKLAFFAAVAILTATFLNFPVACLVALSVLFIAETSGYLQEALHAYTPDTTVGYDYVAAVSRVVAVPVAYLFQWYGDLRAATNLADGRLVAWPQAFRAVATLVLASAGVLLVAWRVFARRELAMYSGR
ncbi:MAG: hypothetical protein EA379_08045 [Phycisphaerales bacterium]|nr:MAG: hypothetical protein EA379_08045 [Phycisphaerales bacterium]